MTDLCSQCECIGGADVTNVLISNGFCNDETNTVECNYDGGDCCGSCVLKNLCNKCVCLGEADVTNVLIGNGFCNDEANNADCYYDGGDCCKSNAVL